MNLVTLAADAHDVGMSFWDELWSITFDPAHIVSELIWQLVFDGLFVAFFYGIVVKRWILPRLRREIHKDLDAEHGIEHHDDHIHIAGLTKPHD